jgi:hypothetical protein
MPRQPYCQRQGIIDNFLIFSGSKRLGGRNIMESRLIKANHLLLIISALLV